MNGMYILDDAGNPVPCDDTRKWGAWFQDMDRRRVASDELGEVRVSTVFLGLDHSFGDGPPLLFETMIFGGPHNDYQERYATREEALAGHAAAVTLARGSGS